MASFKLTINDPKNGQSYQKEVKEQQADLFLGLNIGEKVDGSNFELSGFEFEVRGGSDKSGFPMRRGIKAIRHKILSKGGVGFRKMRSGMKKRKTVCGHKINDNIVQINLKVVKEGSKKLADIFNKAEKKDEKPKAEAKKEDKKSEPKKEVVKKPEAKKEEPKKAEEKQAPKPEAKKEEPKKETKAEEKKE